jgi:hypothetical protein
LWRNGSTTRWRCSSPSSGPTTRRSSAASRCSTVRRGNRTPASPSILYDLVFKEEGPEVCGRFAQDGSAALFELGLSEKYAEALDQQSVVYFKSVVLAIENPEPSAPVRPGDWDVVLRLMLEAGAPPSFAATVAAGDPADPDLCPALTALLLTMSLMDEPEGQRVRADFAQNVAGY